jgi:hypothetical protein
MLVPEAAMHHHYFVATWKNEVRPPRQVAAMKSEAVTECVGDAANQDLRPRVFAPDS